MRFMFTFTITLCSLGAFADMRFTHRWYDYPVETNQCQSEADRIATEAAKAAPEIQGELGVGTVKLGGCRIELSYDYYSHPLCLSTIWSRDSHISPCPEYGGLALEDDVWQYSSMEDCQSDLTHQKNLFEQMTGTHVVMAHCYFETKIKAPNLRIVGFGPRKIETKVLRPDILSVPPPFHDTSNIIAKISDWLAAQGSTVSRVASSPSHQGTLPSYIHFYRSSKTPAIRELFLGRKLYAEYFRGLELPTLNACEEQLSEVQSLLKKLKAESLATFCGVDASKSIVTLHALYAGGQSFTPEWAPFEYASYEQCRADKDRVTKVYQEKLKKTVYGLFCSKLDNVFRLRMFLNSSL